MLRGGAGCCLLAACLLAGCLGENPEESGVVAVVNGAPIRLAALEARHEVGRLGMPAFENPAVEELRTEYGATLADLIVSRLVAQELARRKLSPTSRELVEAEEAVRADYPGDAFERLLLEEHLDLARWRAMLADRLAQEKFTREVLRPTLRVGVSEAATYYKEHINTFTRPASVRVLVVSGRDADAVKALLAKARKLGQGEEAGAGIAQAVLPEAGLPAAWRDALKGLKPGEATPPLPSGREQIGLVLLERLPSAVLDPAKAYARVEALLAEEKLTKAFAAWLAEALAAAHISINRQLLAEGKSPETGPASPSAQAGRQPEQTEIETARAEDAARAYVAAQAQKTLADKREAAAAVPVASGQTVSPAAVPLSPGPTGAGGAGLPVVAGETIPAAEPAAAPGQPEQGAEAAPPPDLTPAAPPVSADLAPVAIATPAVPPVLAEPSHAATPGATAPATAPSGLGAPVPPAASPSHDAAVVAAAGDAPASLPAPPQALQAPAGGEVEFVAVKASWILYIVDEGQEERVYLKPGKPQRIAYSRRLVVRLGSPSEVTYRAGGREATVEVGRKESRVLEFP
nr:peptidyl-prolyl cis-trans isomerase [Solidesulfovibrio aerotolerans]